jgi:hypothetical protein
VYSRTKELNPASMENQFCKIRNGCFKDDFVNTNEPESGLGSPKNPFRGILASTKVSEILGVERVEARDMIRRDTPTAPVLQPIEQESYKRAWWYNVGDYLENPHRHFETMDSLRVPMEWPTDLVSGNK